MVKLGTVVWVVGNFSAGTHWGIIGVFNTEAEALLVIGDSDSFLGPIKFGHVGPSDPTKWDGCYYPHEMNSNNE